MIIDLLLMAVGWVLTTAAAVVQVRRSPGLKVGPFATRQQRNRAPRLNWRSLALFIAGCAVAVVGGADARRHHIGSWALLLVFVPMIAAEMLVVAAHNSRLEPTDAPTQHA